MEPMSSPETVVRSGVPCRPLKRVEYERLAAEGFFEDEKVELLLGVVVPMSPIDPAHSTSQQRLAEKLRRAIAGRAELRESQPLAASEISEPQPDIMVVPALGDAYWSEHPARALLVVEISRSSLRTDKGPKAIVYGLAEVDEYWIVNHVESVVEVYRDRHAGEWRQRSTQWTW